MLGIGFWSMAKIGRSNTAINMYLIITGFGFFLLFTSNQAILMSIVPYPPFGIATITVMGVSAYLIVIGIYMSTITLSQDAELRRSIKQIARSQSKLFDSMVTRDVNIRDKRRYHKRVPLMACLMACHFVYSSSTIRTPSNLIFLCFCSL